MKKKTPLSSTTKTLLIYSGELLIFSLVFLALGILVLTKVFYLSELRQQIFTWVTLFGGLVTLGDFLWVLLSKKRRKKSSLIDKILVAPVGLGLFVADLTALIMGNMPYEFYQFAMGGVFCYLGLVYAFEGVFHYFHPIPGLLEDEEEKPTNSADEKK